MNNLKQCSDQLLFVCYYPGAGGENLSVEISKFDTCEPLQCYFTEQSRTVITNDLFGKNFLIPVGPFDHLLQRVKEIAIDLPVLERTHVVPSHWDVKYLEPEFPNSKFIRILSPGDIKILQTNTNKKVMQGHCRTLLELKGYCLMYVDMLIFQDLFKKQKIKLSMTIGEIHNVLRPFIDTETFEHRFCGGGVDLYTNEIQKQNVISIPYQGFEQCKDQIKNFLYTKHDLVH